MKFFSFLFSVSIIFLYYNPVHSKPNFPSLIPNGKVNNCSNCHISPYGGGQRTPFGETTFDNLSNGNVRWDLIFNIDSDGDGFTNGEELQDPDGQWAFGQSDPGNPSLVTLPGDASSKPTTSSVEDEFANYNSKIYPVPTIGIINLEYLSNYFDSSRLELFNANGNIVYAENIDAKIGQNKWTINLNNYSLNNGVYFLVLRNKYYNIRKRIVFSK
jgi:hypothetical protein